MAGIFVEANPNLTPEQRLAIAKRGGQMTAAEKSPEERMYIAIIKFNQIEDDAPVEEDETTVNLDGGIVEIGRKNLFVRISELVTSDEVHAIDVRHSQVFVEGVALTKFISLYRFIDLCNHEYPEESIEEYLQEYPITDDSDKPMKVMTDMGVVVATGTGAVNAGTMLNN